MSLVLYVYVYMYTIMNIQQIRGKDDNVVTEEELNNLKLLRDVVLEPGDVLYIPRGYLHQVSLYDSTDDLYMTEDDDYAIHLSVGLEVDTLGFTMESFMFCAMGLSLNNVSESDTKQRQHQKQKQKDDMDLDQKLKDYARLTWLSGYLWQYSFMIEDLRKVFPFFESEYLLRKAEKDGEGMEDLQDFQKILYENTMEWIDKFEVALKHTNNVDPEKLKENKVPDVTIEDIKLAHSVFHEGLERLRRLFLAKMSLAKDEQFEDVVDRNAKFDELMVEEIENVYKRCGVPVAIVGDGDQEFNVNTK